MDLSPNGFFLVASNEEGETFMISMISQMVIHTYKFKTEPKFIKFSPCGMFFGICVDQLGKFCANEIEQCKFDANILILSLVYIFKAPGITAGQVNSFVIERIFHDSQEGKTCLEWSFDSRFIMVGSADNSAKVYALRLFENFHPFILAGHYDEIINCSFEDKSLNALIISRNGQLSIWHCSMKVEDFKELEYVKQEPEQKRQKENDSEDEADDLSDEEKVEEFVDSSTQRDKQGKIIVQETKDNRFFYKRAARHYLMDELKKENRNVKLTSACYQKNLKILVTAYSTGAFYLHDYPALSVIHSLNISQHSVDAVTFNSTGDWIALGVSRLGQLLVWEWQSEQYVMKQQGHSNVMSSIAYSPDGNFIVTGNFK